MADVARERGHHGRTRVPSSADTADVVSDSITGVCRREGPDTDAEAGGVAEQ